jgi:predicted CXXCH cytochrome family protein
MTGRLPILLTIGLVCAVGCRRAETGPPAKEATEVANKPLAKTKLISPPDRSILPPEPFELILIGPEKISTEKIGAEKLSLCVDGKPIEWEPVAAPIYLARLDLPAGHHKVSAGSKEWEYYIQTGDADLPDGFETVFTHPIDDELEKRRCAACHPVSELDGKTTLGPAETPDACIVCHDQIELQVAHDEHPSESLENCAECHNPHGAHSPALLRRPRRELCLGCHDAAEIDHPKKDDKTE